MRLSDVVTMAANELRLATAAALYAHVEAAVEKDPGRFPSSNDVYNFMLSLSPQFAQLTSFADAADFIHNVHAVKSKRSKPDEVCKKKYRFAIQNEAAAEATKRQAETDKQQLQQQETDAAAAEATAAAAEQQRQAAEMQRQAAAAEATSAAAEQQRQQQREADAAAAAAAAEERKPFHPFVGADTADDVDLSEDDNPAAPSGDGDGGVAAAASYPLDCLARYEYNLLRLNRKVFKTMCHTSHMQ